MAGTASRIVEKFGGLFKFNHRMLSFFSMGTRVGLIFLLSAAVPLNLSQGQNFTAHNPSGNPAVVIARLECIKIHTGRVHFWDCQPDLVCCW